MTIDHVSKIAIIDFDETLIRYQSQKLFIDFLYKGKYIKSSRYYLILLWFVLYKIGFVVKVDRIFSYAISILKNRRVEDFESIFDHFFYEICVPNLYNNSLKLIDFLKDKGFYIIILSTAIDPIISRAKKYFEVDDILCTKLEIINDFYTGNIVGKPIFSDQKITAITTLIGPSNFQHKMTLSFADHYSDIKLLSLTTNPVVTNPQKGMLKYAHMHNWPVLYLDDDESFQYFKSNIMFK